MLWVTGWPNKPSAIRTVSSLHIDHFGDCNLKVTTTRHDAKVFDCEIP